MGQVGGDSEMEMGGFDEIWKLNWFMFSCLESIFWGGSSEHAHIPGLLVREERHRQVTILQEEPCQSHDKITKGMLCESVIPSLPFRELGAPPLLPILDLGAPPLLSIPRAWSPSPSANTKSLEPLPFCQYQELGAPPILPIPRAWGPSPSANTESLGPSCSTNTDSLETRLV